MIPKKDIITKLRYLVERITSDIITLSLGKNRYQL